MSIKNRLRILANSIPPEMRPEDPAFIYALTADNLDRVSHNIMAAFGPPPDKESMLKQFSPEQVQDVWLRHYHYYVNGRLSEPPIEWVKEKDRLALMSNQDWYEANFHHILAYPHRIEFALERFGLDSYLGHVENCAYIEYNPRT